MRTLLVLLVAIAPACNRDLAGKTVDGSKVFSEVCARCHGPTGKPNKVMVATLGVKDLTAPALRARISPALVVHQIEHGSTNHRMPSFAGALTDAQIKAVAAYVASPRFVARK